GVDVGDIVGVSVRWVYTYTEFMASDKVIEAANLVCTTPLTIAHPWLWQIPVMTIFVNALHFNIIHDIPKKSSASVWLWRMAHTKVCATTRQNHPRGWPWIAEEWEQRLF
ncbi:MAG: hypothetical protein NT045_02560, partial [Candidatus Aureabacteria bacterium]|nr:hypothetical protein [Candidatus Auribacterota bacterium]